MIRIQLQAIPNQATSIKLDGSFYDLLIKESGGVMVVSISRDNVKLIDSTRLLPATPILPYTYIQSGNFFMLTDNDDIPDWQQFGISQYMIFAMAAEIEAAIAGT
jgi:hypothetical protein